MMAFAIIDGSRRLRNGSFRSFRHPATMSGPRSASLDHAGNVARIVLKIAVGGDDETAARVREAGGEGGGLAEVAPEPDHAQPRVRRLQRGQLGERVVRAAVVDRDDLVRTAEPLEHRGELAIELRHVGRFVAHRYDDRYLREASWVND